MAETRTDLETAVKPSTDPFIIEFISATDIPLYDGKSKSDPFIQAYISAHVEKLDALNRRVFSLQRVSNLVQTPRRLDCTAVTWHCYRDFNVKPSTEAILTVELYHHNKDAQKGVPLGKIDIPVGKFVDDEPIKFPLYVVKGATQGKNPNFSVILRRAFATSPVPQFRTFFLIRHGESKWNEAQAKINIGGMLDRDHPLTSDGVNQACALNARWKLARMQNSAKYASDQSRRGSMCADLIDFSKMNEDDFMAMDDDGFDDYNSDGGSDEEGVAKGAGKRLGRLYDSIFQRYSNVTVTGKSRQSVSAPGTGSTSPTPTPNSDFSKGTRNSYVPSFLDSDILDFTADAPLVAPPPPAATVPLTGNLIDLLDDDPPPPAAPTDVPPSQRPVLPPIVDPFDLLDGYSSVAAQNTAATLPQTSPDTASITPVTETVAEEEGVGGADDDDLPQRREEYIRLFLQADIVYTSPLTRAVQTALAAMCGHGALEQNRLTLYSIIREIKRIGGLDTVGIEHGSGVMRRVMAELQLAIGVARAHEIMDTVKVDVNDANAPWWTSVSGFETEKDTLDRVREFITFSRYCECNLPVFVGHSLFFKEFCSKRISAVMSRKRPHLSANLKRYRLSNASLLAVTVKYVDLDNGCSEAVVVDADLIFGGGFHGVKLAHDSTGHGSSGRFTAAGAELQGAEEVDIDGAMRHPPPSQVKRVASSLQHTINHKVTTGVSSGSKVIGRKIGMLASSIGGFFDSGKPGSQS